MATRRWTSWAAVGVVMLGSAIFPAWGQTTSSAPAVTAGEKKILALTARGIIGPTLADYLIKQIEAARPGQYECIVIELDTPGGLDESMRDIIKAIMSSDVPVVTFVWPKGARAASAGTFIVLGSDVAAMAPETTIGAAHPVGVEGSAVSEKVTNDAAAYIRMLASEHGRNVAWAEKAVRESVSVDAREALKLHVVDLVASSMTDLLTRLDGRKVQVAGRSMILHTRDLEVVNIQPNWVQNFFQVLGHPNLAYVLLILGIWGLYFELANPGMVLPGVVGGLALILGLLALSVLPVNLAGILLILLAIILFTADLFTPTHGVLTVGGVIAFVLGSFLLFPADGPYGRVPWDLIIAGSGSTAVFFGLVLWLVIKAQRGRVIMGVEKLPGADGVAQSALNPCGIVHVRGEQWSAQSVEGSIEEGSRIEVVGVEGLTLKVRKRA